MTELPLPINFISITALSSFPYIKYEFQVILYSNYPQYSIWSV